MCRNVHPLFSEAGDEVNRRRSQRIVALVAALASVMIIPLAANLLAAENAKMLEVSSWILSAVGLIGALVGVLVSARQLGIERAAGAEKEQAAINLIDSLDEIERLVVEIQRRGPQRFPHARSYVSLRQVRNVMVGFGVWRASDLVGFDLAVRARNAVVHGDIAQVDDVDLEYAAYKAGKLLEKAQVWNRDLVQDEIRLRRAADAGDASAMMRLANMLDEQGDRRQAEILYRRAMDAGDVSALSDLARLLREQGENGEVEALYRRAVEAGQVSALGNLANLL
ncbi:tetratricopeptide repeat protein, partial [Micromonospora humida]|uniref:tetratricopeptide repeat protein n=1 Tax=Micromonospora humida TaxID=2809018 RepID=UPI00366D3137